ncbi:MAG: DNA mismatch repair protein MutS [Flavobacteriales bacterium]|nr:MAG: DNA mismatch repair protein MutS [Flavobacteriales bacterium]
MITIDHKTLESLEFPEVLEEIASFSVTELGRKSVLTILPFKKLVAIQPELERVKEFSVSLNGENAIPNHGFEAIERELFLLNIDNSTLEISGFRKILSITETTRILISFFKKYETFYIHLNTFSQRITYFASFSSEIKKVIDKYGFMRDDASQELSIIRKRLKLLKSKINSSFNKSLSQYNQLEYLDEIRETIVDNRRVLAVKAMYRKKINGTVLGTSKTGSIVYMEPQKTLEYANELSNLLYEEQEEIKKILKELTEYFRPSASILKKYQEYLISMDVLYAKAKFALLIDGVMPILSEKRKLILKDAYHPLLLLTNKKRKEKTFPQTISLHEDNRIIVISGPNAGGKSITLKTVGLLQLMLQSGILVPLDPLSEFCFFEKILTDIGDNQSIENQLSTYSYRLKKMNQFLKKCKENSLFLIDEFGTGSDPELGGALAEIFLEVFYERKAFGVITTHYANLKLLASELPHATNANMQFNSSTLLPMYQLNLGEAGSSFTFEVAQKNGIPYSIINKAKKKIEKGKIRFDKSIANLQKERIQLRKTSESLKNEEKKARLNNQQLETTHNRIQDKLESYQELYDTNQRLISLGKKISTLAKNYHNNKKKKPLMDNLFKIIMVENSKLKKPQPKIKKVKKQEKKQQHDIKQEVEKKVAIIRKKKKKDKAAQKQIAPTKPIVSLKVGDRVKMIDGNAVGTIDKLEKKKAFVNYGSFKTNVNVSELEKI